MFLRGWLVFIVVSGTARSNGEKKAKPNDYFAAIVHMEPLVRREQLLTENFLEIINSEEQRLNKMEKEIDEIERVLPKPGYTPTEMTKFIGNSVNALKLLQRFTDFWPNITTKYSGENSTLRSQIKLKRLLSAYHRDFPGESDIKGAIDAIFRLQDLYKISPQSFADGLGPRSHRLILEEIFELGFIALGAEDYWHARPWLREAYERFHPDAKQVGFVDKASLLEYLAWAEYKTGNIEQAIELTEKVLEINPDSESANTNIQFFEEDYAKMQASQTLHKFYERPKTNWSNKYEILCNDGEKMDPEIKKKLFCKYEVPSAFFAIHPVKTEEVFMDPDIKIFHDFLSDFEINYLERLSQNKLKRATVHDPVTGILKYSNHRISKSFWINEDEDVVVGKIFQRVQQLTGLDMMFSEPLQIVNYGIGGHYEPHYDYATPSPSNPYKHKWRNRIATALLYMSDVLQGGSTVFVSVGKGVITRPRKGDLVFWYNLKRSGEGDTRTRHAACPVVLGTKWVANFWIHEYGQEFIRRCGMTKDE